jgi:hypothetical protein
MGLRYLVVEHAGKGMMVQTFQDGILKLNHLLLDEFSKGRKYTHVKAVGDSMPP